MLNRSKRKTTPYAHENKWQNYQLKLKKKDTVHRSYRRIPIYAVAAVVLAVLIHGVFALMEKSLATPETDYAQIFTQRFETFDKTGLQNIFNRIPFAATSERNFELTSGETAYQIRSSIDSGLQEFMMAQIDRKNSKHFGFVAMDPSTGRVLSMVSYDKNGQDINICTAPDYPAASLFKIITAAAAIEKCGFNCNTPVTFNDNKYTLYKVQLKDRINKYTNRITFAESFADSVNPVFGKLGRNSLGKSALESYAAAFGFNQSFDFEIPLTPSTICVSEDPYNWAEIACGFNRKTLISPMHGALLVSGIVNKGKLIEPTIIDSIGKSDQTLYQRNSHVVSDVVNPSTALTLKKLMQETVISGTASKSFSRFRKDAILSRLNIGGKTGSINKNSEHLKYDWFVGFAEEKNGTKKIVISVLVVHQDYIGTRAAMYSRMAIKEYFQNYYANIKDQKTDSAAAL